MIKVFEQKVPNDLHILRQTKAVPCFIEIIRKPPICHKSDIKNLGKNLDLIIKLMINFSSIKENRNYLIATNRLTVMIDLLLWILNKPSKIPLAVSFLPDLLYLLRIHIKHNVPYEYLMLKNDFLEYAMLSNVTVKFKQKFLTINRPIDISGGFGNISLVIIRMIGMLEAMTFNITAKLVFNQLL